MASNVSTGPADHSPLPLEQQGTHLNHLTLFVDFYICPHLIEAWKEGHRPVWAACAQEPECLLFDVVRPLFPIRGLLASKNSILILPQFNDSSDPGHFRLVEVWNATKEWFVEKQLTKPYYAELWAKTEWTYRKDRRIGYMERLGEGFSWRREYLVSGSLVGGDSGRVQE
jgi:quinol monooxygenase YgiN